MTIQPGEARTGQHQARDTQELMDAANRIGERQEQRYSQDPGTDEFEVPTQAREQATEPEPRSERLDEERTEQREDQRADQGAAQWDEPLDDAEAEPTGHTTGRMEK